MSNVLSPKPAVFRWRRLELSRRFPQTVFVIPSGREAMRSHSVAHRFQSPSDFFYLTGLRAAQDMFLVIAEGRSYLFRKQPDQEQLLWDGDGLIESEKHLLADFGVEGPDRLEPVLFEHVRDSATLALPIGRTAETDALALKLAGYRRGARKSTPLQLVDSRVLVGQVRMIKEKVEIACLREAGRLSSRAHHRVMSSPLSGRREIDIAHDIEAEFLRSGMTGAAYGTIVGSGDRATILHARAGDRAIGEDELVLIDAGGEWQGYCSDITRTLPAGRRFTGAQRELYEIVLGAQKAAIAAVVPGCSIQDIHIVAREQLIDGLARAGVAESEARERIATWQPHGTSHWIGLDVHDPALYHDCAGEPLRLLPGMCFTVEPALYFRDGSVSKFQGLGVRIEDDVLVTESGREILTVAPKEIEEVEALRAGV